LPSTSCVDADIDQGKSYARLALGMREAALPNTSRERPFQPVLWKNRLVARAIQAAFTNQLDFGGNVGGHS